jgi:hypothetical protein
MAGVASAQEEIDEATGKFLRPRGANPPLELSGQFGRANFISAVASRKSAAFDRGDIGRAAAAQASGLSERDCSH